VSVQRASERRLGLPIDDQPHSRRGIRTASDGASGIASPHRERADGASRTHCTEGRGSLCACAEEASAQSVSQVQRHRAHSARALKRGFRAPCLAASMARVTRFCSASVPTQGWDWRNVDPMHGPAPLCALGFRRAKRRSEPLRWRPNAATTFEREQRCAARAPIHRLLARPATRSTVVSQSQRLGAPFGATKAKGAQWLWDVRWVEVPTVPTLRRDACRAEPRTQPSLELRGTVRGSLLQRTSPIGSSACRAEPRTRAPQRLRGTALNRLLQRTSPIGSSACRAEPRTRAPQRLRGTVRGSLASAHESTALVRLPTSREISDATGTARHCARSLASAYELTALDRLPSRTEIPQDSASASTLAGCTGPCVLPRGSGDATPAFSRAPTSNAVPNCATHGA
jgi:hypothetical protein